VLNVLEGRAAEAHRPRSVGRGLDMRSSNLDTLKKKSARKGKGRMGASRRPPLPGGNLQKNGKSVLL